MGSLKFFIQERICSLLFAKKIHMGIRVIALYPLDRCRPTAFRFAALESSLFNFLSSIVCLTGLHLLS
jgi:hypothetical protein